MHMNSLRRILCRQGAGGGGGHAVRGVFERRLRNSTTTTTTTTSSNSCGNISQFFTIRSQSSRSQASRSSSSSSSAPQVAYNQSVDVFPSIVIGPNKSIISQGPFAEAQAQFLDPDPDAVARLGESLLRTNMGVVAHYYMDVELQGVLTAVQRLDPALHHRIGIADSLKMGDMAVTMCTTTNPTTTTATTPPPTTTTTTRRNDEDGNSPAAVQGVVCLGVDFMAESVAAIMSRNGYGHVPVYRATSNPIGCSLAESAERDTYRAWLESFHRNSNATAAAPNDDHDAGALHVVYINTSLETKAVSTSIIPTITCTSSNVLQTMLQASAQMGPNLKILYGPDTYMGHNLQSLLETVSSSSSSWDDARIARDLHPMHTQQSIARLRDNLFVFPHGNCIVHHMFGNAVVQTVRDRYDDCYVTAHLEVPGEMFQIAMEKSVQGKGVVGSTSDILRFISTKVEEAAMTTTTTTTTKTTTTSDTSVKRLKFILGTEAGMVTSIVKSVQDILERHNSQVEAEIIFPVASDAVMGVASNDDTNDNDDNNSIGNLLGVVPGAGGGEGCSTAGGCATCPFMKMNDLDALQGILDMVEDGNHELTLKAHLPPNRLRGRSINGRDAMDLGVESIMYMRDFMTTKRLSDNLVQKIRMSGNGDNGGNGVAH